MKLLFILALGFVIGAVYTVIHVPPKVSVCPPQAQHQQSQSQPKPQPQRAPTQEKSRPVKAVFSLGTMAAALVVIGKQVLGGLVIH